MDDRTFRMTSIVGAAVLYAGLLGYSFLGAGGGQPAKTTDASVDRMRPPRVMHHDDGVAVYSRRSVRAGTQRGGGIRAGK